MPLAGYQTCDSRGMTEGIPTILHLGNKFQARRKSSVTHAIWYPLSSFYEKGEKEREAASSYTDQDTAGQNQLLLTTAETAAQLVLFSPSCISVEHRHFPKPQYQSELSQIYIRKPIIITGSVTWPINCRRIAFNCTVNGKRYADATVLH